MARLIPVVFDFESFWSQEHTLTKLNPVDYVMHPNTEIQSCSITVPGKNTQVVFGEAALEQVFARMPWERIYAIGHNMAEFDAMILAWRFGVSPAKWGCTQAMARPLFAKTSQLSLDALLTYLDAPFKKGSLEATNTKGLRLADFTPEMREAMRGYNTIDGDACMWLFKKLAPMVGARELEVIDATIRSLVDLKFQCDAPLLEETLAGVKEDKRKALLECADLLGVDPEADEPWRLEEVRSALASAPKFSKILEAYGFEVPMKPSKTAMAKGEHKLIPALSKTDEAMEELVECDHPVISAAAQTRLGVKSTQLESRIETFLRWNHYLDGAMPVPLRYCGADTTGRWSGTMKANMQNLPRIPRDKDGNIIPKRSNALRECLLARPGHKVIVADQSGIELRVNHYLWQVEDSMELYARDATADLYRAFAAARYAIAPEEVTKPQRQLAKVCLSEGSLVLFRHGEKVFWAPIEQYGPSYQLWDGVEWVWAKGLASNGLKQTQPLCGLWLTPDHLVLSGTQWKEAGSLHGESLRRALETGREAWSSLGLSPGQMEALKRPSSNATADSRSTPSRATTSLAGRLLAAICALKKRPGASGTGATTRSCRTSSTERDCSTGSTRRSTDATTQMTPATPTTVAGAYESMQRGRRTRLSFYATFKRYLGGTTRRLSLTGRTSTEATSRATSGSYPARKTCSTSGAYKISSEGSLSLRNVYDITDCGPRHRFMALTDEGPVIVHNCHLGLGFGAGAETFRVVAKLMGGIVLNEVEAAEAVSAWRGQYRRIVNGWRVCHEALTDVYLGREREIDPWGLTHTCKEGIVLPSGRIIRYPSLHEEPRERGRGNEWWYGQGRHRARIYAGKVDENIVQALARDIITDNMLEFRRRTGLSPSLLVHDELVYVVPDAEAEALLAELQSIMRTSPSYWPEIVLWSEGDIGDRYSDAK